MVDPIKHIRRSLPPWCAGPAGVLSGAIILFVIRGGTSRAWALANDDANWVSMTRSWCAGARLYADVWNNKGPLFFLWMRPFCLVPPTSPILVDWEVAVFWAPLLAVVGICVGWLAHSVALRVGAAFFLGLATCLIFWNGCLSALFGSEPLGAAFILLALCGTVAGRRDRPRADCGIVVALGVTAACLVNWRFATYGLLYLFIPFSPRRFLRDASLALLFAAIVLFFAIGLDREGFAWFLRTLDTVGDFRAPSWADRLAQALRAGVFGHRGLLGFLTYPAALPIFASFGTWYWSALAAFAVTMLGPLRHLLRHPLAWKFACVFVAVYPSVIATGLVFPHCYEVLLPLIVVGMAALLHRARARAEIALALWCGLWLAVQTTAAGPEFSYHSRAASPLITELQLVSAAYSRYLGGRPWVSLLSNGAPVLLAPGVGLPRNRMFHSYCRPFPKWSEQEIRGLIQKGGVRLAIHASLGEKRECPTAALVTMARGRCSFVATVPDPYFGAVEFRDCPGSIDLAQRRRENGVAVVRVR